MPRRKEDENWPYIERLTPARVADQRQGALVARGWCVLKLTRRRETALPKEYLPETKPPVLPEFACDGFQGGMGI